MTQRAAHMHEKDGKILLVFLYLVAYGLLLLLYASYVVPYWEYLGYIFDLQIDRVFYGALIIAFFVVAIRQDSSVRSILLNILLTIYLLPAIVIYSAGGANTTAFAIICSAVAVVFMVSAIPMARIYVINIRTKTLMWCVVAATATFVSLVIILGGYRNFNLNLAAVYEFRQAAADGLPGVFSYLRPVFSNVVIPFGIATALVHRKYIVVFILCFAALMLFGFTSHKSIIFIPIVVIFAFIVLKKFKKYSVLMSLFVLSLILSQVDVFLIRGEEEAIFGWYSSLLTRRVLMQRALIEYQYLELFSDISKYYWSYSRVTFGLVDDPHGINAPRLIGENFYGSSDANANTGFVGSGYSQAGIWGVYIYAVGVGLLFSFLQAYGKYMGVPYVVAATSSFVLVIFAADFLTLFMTHGMLVLVLLFTLVRSPQAEGRDNGESHTLFNSAPQAG